MGDYASQAVGLGSGFKNLNIRTVQMFIIRMKCNGLDQASGSSGDLIHPCLELVDRFNLSEAWNLPIIASTVTLLFVVELKPNYGIKALLTFENYLAILH